MEPDRAHYSVFNAAQRSQGPQVTGSTRSLNGILWILRTGAPWKDLPQRYPPHQTCHPWFKQWVRDGIFQRIAQELVEDLHERGQIDIREAFIDGCFAPAKKGVMLLARQSVTKAPRSWQSQTLLVFLSPLTWKALRPMK